MEYIIRRANIAASATDWHDWHDADTLEVAHFRPESSSHRPHTQARLLHDETGIRGIFRVEDRYVRCLRTKYGEEVWKDSCVELFLQPREDRGYFNFEFNCGGAFLCCYIVNPERTADGFKEFTRVPWEVASKVDVRASLSATIDPEITSPLVWILSFTIPFSLFEHYLGPLGDVSGQAWRGNFFKCAEENSHPHWAAWSPVDEFNFHLPQCFGRIRLEKNLR